MTNVSRHQSVQTKLHTSYETTIHNKSKFLLNNVILRSNRRRQNLFQFRDPQQACPAAKYLNTLCIPIRIFSINILTYTEPALIQEIRIHQRRKSTADITIDITVSSVEARDFFSPHRKQEFAGRSQMAFGFARLYTINGGQRGTRTRVSFVNARNPAH